MIDDARRLAAIVVDRVRVRVRKDGKSKGTRIPASHLSTMLVSEVFLQQFRPIDDVVREAQYRTDFSLFALDVMPFATNADRTNTVGLALTKMLRNYWPGGKPVGVVTSTKSHGGKETIITYVAGRTPKVSVDYQRTDWAFRQGLSAGLTSCPDAGLVNIENVRSERGEKYLASAPLERLLTDPEPSLHSSKARHALKFRNYLIFTITTNYGTVSENLMNRGLPIHLTPTGNVAELQSPIGNPKLEYLPQNCERIEAELRGMIEKWKEMGRPHDTSIRHPFTEKGV